MKPKIDHIHVTVADIKRAEAFYDQLLPIPAVIEYEIVNFARTKYFH